MAVVVPALAFPLLFGFWVFLCWRVRVERGRVLSPMRAYLLALRRLERAFGEAFVLIVRRTATQIAAWNRAWEEAVAADPELRALLLEEGGTE